MSYSSFTRGEFTRLHTSTPKAVWSHWLSLWFTLLLSSSIQRVTPLSSAMALTLLRNSTQFEMPSSSDMPRRFPAWHVRRRGHLELCAVPQQGQGHGGGQRRHPLYGATQ